MRLSDREIEARLRKVGKRIGEFDLVSLLYVVESLGFAPDEIRFVSHHTLVSQPGLLHEVKFVPDPRHVLICLNMGLLSAQSPLPSYFFRRMDSPGFDLSSFVQFAGFFDHGLLKNYLMAIYPELNRQLYPDWERSKRRDLLLLNLKSTSTMHWLFQTVFPELVVRIEKAKLDRELKTAGVQLGTATLGGDAVFGKKASVPVQGRRVTLFAAAERAGSGKHWPAEIGERMTELVFPILAAVGVELELILVIQEQETVATLQSGSYLGYDKVSGGEKSYRSIKLHAGHVVQ